MEPSGLAVAITFVFFNTVAQIGLTWRYHPKLSAESPLHNILVCSQHCLGLASYLAFVAVWCTRNSEPNSLWPTLVLAQPIYLSTVQAMLEIRSWFVTNAYGKMAVAWLVSIAIQAVLTVGGYLAEHYTYRCQLFTGSSLLVVSSIGVASFVGARKNMHAFLSIMDCTDGFGGIRDFNRIQCILKWLWLPGLFYILVPMAAAIDNAKKSYLVAYFMTLPWEATLLYYHRIAGRSNPNRDTTQPLSSPATLSSA
ncbi:hypothetical protein GQ607_002368 [Colletotrichum asianum]|uniref:Uncharacterized protein n=1 Tax=Colletotrichum asianum TaxID=702518 RepID=A0A8H3ZS42_9PEZI|nr:hypothetical protein GQ607_002368 [Colletotrichum asianum]